MRSQRQLRDELRFVTEFGALLDVMQHVALSKLRRADEQHSRQYPVADVLRREYFPLLPPEAAQDPLVRGGARGRLVVVVTSDEGMVGPLHTAVIRQALATADGPTTQWLFVGQRGWRVLGWQAAQPWVISMPTDERADELMRQVGRQVLERYVRQALRDVWLIAPRFHSMAHQDVMVQQLFPLPLGDRLGAGTLNEVIIEPSLHEVLHQVARFWVEQVCVEALWSARRAEYAARALHVEVSRQELTKQTNRLRYQFFKTFHERVNVLVRETGVVQRYIARRGVARRTSR